MSKDHDRQSAAYTQEVEKNVATVQHALSMIGGIGWIARSEAEQALGRLAAWADHGLREAELERQIAATPKGLRT